MEVQTVSQALRRIKELKGKLAEHLTRAQASLSYDKEQPPAFDFKAELERAEGARSELVALEAALRATNATAKLEWRGRAITLSEATCVLQETRSRIAWLRMLPCAAQRETKVAQMKYDLAKSVHYEAVDVRVCALTEAERADLVEREQDAFRALNDAVEALNHSTRLVRV